MIRAKIALERFGDLSIKVSDMKMKTNNSRKKNNEKKINNQKSFRIIISTFICQIGNENCYLECQWHQIV